MCNVIESAQKQDLSNYHVRVAGINLPQYILSHGKLHKRDGYAFSKAVGYLIWNTLKARVSYKYFSWNQVGKMGSDGIATGIFGDVLQGQFESSIAADFNHGLWKNEMNLLKATGLCFVTKKKIVPMFEQISNIFSVATCLLLLVFFTIVITLLAYLLKMSYVEAALDIIRAAVNVSMVQVKANSNASKFIFISLIFNFIILSSYLQSQFSAILAVPISKYKSMRTAIDLVENGYKVYADEYYSQFYYNTALYGNINPIEDFTQCLAFMDNNDSAACLNDCNWIGNSVHESEKLHISQDEFFSRYDAFAFRDDSPLLDRAERIYRRLFEGGFVAYALSMEKLMFQSEHTREFRNISLYQLQHAFYSLLILHVIAFLVFLIELCKDSKKISKFNSVFIFVKKWRDSIGN